MTTFSFVKCSFFSHACFCTTSVLCFPIFPFLFRFNCWLCRGWRQTNGCITQPPLGRGGRQMGQRVLHRLYVQCSASHQHDDYHEYYIWFIHKCALHWRRRSSVISRFLLPVFPHDGPYWPSLVHRRFREQCDSQYIVVVTEIISVESLSGWPSMVQSAVRRLLLVCEGFLLPGRQQPVRVSCRHP